MQLGRSKIGVGSEVLASNKSDHTAEHRGATRSRFIVAASVLLTLTTAPGAALADPILETYNASLTTYLPSGDTLVQGVHPAVLQRGVMLDGTARNAAAFGWSIGGNPFGESWDSKNMLGSVRLDTGAYAPMDTDLALPAPGSGMWVVGRTYNPVQAATGAASPDSDGYQGRNWFQSSQPEIVLFSGATTDKDVLYLVYGADRYLEFKRQGTSGDPFKTFKGVNGTAGAVLYDNVATSGEPDTFTYYDQVGNRAVFFGFDSDAGVAKGQLWKTIDTDGNTAFIGDATTGSTAISSGFDAGGRILYAYDAYNAASGTAGRRRYSYTYDSGSPKHLIQVKAETRTGGTWASSPSGVVEVGKVEYSYNGSNLELVTVTTPLSPGGVSSVAKKYYRYYSSSSRVKYVLGFEGTRRFDLDDDATFNDSFTSASDGDISPYAEAYFTYSSGQVATAYFNGQCGCGGGANGTYTLTYEANGGFSGGAGYDTGWLTRTYVDPPSGEAHRLQYFDEVGQPLTYLQTTAGNWTTIASTWGKTATRDAAGPVASISTNANLDTYTHSSGAFGRKLSLGDLTPIVLVTSTDLAGLRTASKVQIGSGGTAFLTSSSEFTSASLTPSGSSVSIVRPFVSASWQYTNGASPPTTVSTGSGDSTHQKTSYSYSMHTGDAALRPKIIDTTYPIVTTGNNGANSANTASATYRPDGKMDMTLASDGRIDFTDYDAATGLVSTRVTDSTVLGHANYGGWSNTGSPLNITTNYTYDPQGRLDTTTLPDGRVTKNYYTMLADRRLVTISIPRVTAAGGGTYYGPASYKVVNHAGKVEASGIIAVTSSGVTTALSSWVNTASADPIAAVSGSAGAVKKLSTNLYDASGTQVSESRRYFNVPGSGMGSAGTNYDATFFYYDGLGRRNKTKDATGTIDRTVFDALGRMKERWTGTNDHADSNFTDNRESAGASDMVKVEALVYDGGGVGNGDVTQRTQFVQDSTTDQRITNYSYDGRDRVVLTENPQAPHTFVKYDNLSRVIASGQFSSVASIDITTDDPTTNTADRLGLSETVYDERGRAFKSIRHKVTQSSGADADTLASQKWFDSMGRVVKSQGDQLTKTEYDRLGRAVQQYMLAVDNDAAAMDPYAAATGVAGDIVMEQTETLYEDTTGNVLMRATISRDQDDHLTALLGSTETTIALDSNVDSSATKISIADLAGRAQITAMWYDALNRLTDTVQYGNNGGSDFDRSGLSVPARSDTALRTTMTYNDMGLTEDVTDPRALTARMLYDDAGRKITSIANYVNGTPSGPTGDDDITTRYVYTNGLQTQMWLDLDGDGVQDADDQVTTYTFGVTKGTGTMDSKIGSSRLLLKVAYPDSSGGSDVVSYAYNAQGQTKAVEDQAGNIITTSFDTAGRTTEKTVDTVNTGAGFDDLVRQIATAYDGLGRVSTVTQLDATSGGAVLDEVKTTHDDWGNIDTYAQDFNSAVGAGGSTDDWSVQYVYAKSAPGSGRQTVRVTDQKLYQVGNLRHTASYKYTTAIRYKHDDQLSRVSSVDAKISGGTAVTVANYEYVGAGRVGNVFMGEPFVETGLAYSAPGTYDNLDRFNRVVKGIWTSDNASADFYHTELSYDRDSNITVSVDSVLPGWDAAYTMDGRNRLTADDEGTWGGSSIGSGTRKEEWVALDQAGNWNEHRLDLDHNGSWSGAGEMDDSATFNVANEQLTRDLDSTPGTTGNNYSLTHDAAGNLTDDGKDYKYVYDPFGRVRFIKDRSNSVVEEFLYNGYSHRIAWHYDVDTSGTVDVSDPWYRFVYDPQWRMVATVRSSTKTGAGDSYAKEVFVNHQAGADGKSMSLPLDATILRDKDASVAWSAASTSDASERSYYCQNFFGDRGDVVAILTDTGEQVQQVRYSAYGVPTAFPAGDINASGATNVTDLGQILTWIGGSHYDVRADLNLDGVVDSTDSGLLTGNFGVTLGHGSLSLDPDSTITGSSGGHRKGYAGYEHDGVNSRLAHIRNRLYFADIGRWSRRDPLGYVDGLELYAYVQDQPENRSDPLGLCGMGRTCGYAGGGGGIIGGGWTGTGGTDPAGGITGTSILPDVGPGTIGGGGECPPGAVCAPKRYCPVLSEGSRQKFFGDGKTSDYSYTGWSRYYYSLTAGGTIDASNDLFRVMFESHADITKQPYLYPDGDTTSSEIASISTIGTMIPSCGENGTIHLEPGEHSRFGDYDGHSSTGQVSAGVSFDVRFTAESTDPALQGVDETASLTASYRATFVYDGTQFTAGFTVSGGNKVFQFGAGASLGWQVNGTNLNVGGTQETIGTWRWRCKTCPQGGTQ